MSAADPVLERDEEALYQRIVLERARAPKHATRLECFDAEAEGHNPMCGDRLTLRLRRDGSGAVEAVGFEARGCAISLASADLMADAVQGLAAPEIRALAASFAGMVRTGEVPPPLAGAPLRALSGVHEYRARIRCATLAWNALETALGPEETENA